LIIMGYILLEGGAEFGGLMSDPDRRAIDLAGGYSALISIIPTAASPDHNHQRAGNNGQRWFRNLGATNVEVVPLIDRPSADDPSVVEVLRASRLVYLLGGFPGYLDETLSGSSSWGAVLDAYQEGAVVGGSSAGAMVLCQYYYDPEKGEVRGGLNLLPGVCLVPHHNQVGNRWSPRLVKWLPETLIIGIDERTGLINDGVGGSWTVYGAGQVTVYRGEDRLVYRAVESLSL
jgi:cyanophycinase